MHYAQLSHSLCALCPPNEAALSELAVSPRLAFKSDPISRSIWRRHISLHPLSMQHPHSHTLHLLCQRTHNYLSHLIIHTQTFMCQHFSKVQKKNMPSESSM